jgi:hypothetical protein
MMRIPRYWSRIEGDGTDPEGRIVALVALGWSDDGAEAAQARARERLASMIARVERGDPLPHGYSYGDRPLREELLHEVRSAGGELLGLLTRNAYGCIVLNAPRAMFLDVDIPEPSLSQKLRGLFGAKMKSPEEKALGGVRDALRTMPGLSYRIYRTAAGLRVLVTDRTFDPRDPVVERLMASAAADPAYARLCRIQSSFRARLTPKPWRCRRTRPPVRFPFLTDEERERFDAWLVDYERAAEAHATCRLLEEAGGARVHDEIGPLLDLHEDLTRVGTELPLA